MPSSTEKLQLASRPISAAKRSFVFLLLAFALSWTLLIGTRLLGAAEPALVALMLNASMLGPALAAVACALLFERGRRIEALGLRFKPNWWWLAAWLIAGALAGAAVVATIALSDRAYIDIGEASRQLAERQPGGQSNISPLLFETPIIITLVMLTGALVNGPILTLTEELGWRGYLHGLWRPSGFWRASLGIGFFWGVWHAPAIYLYGHNYPDQPALGVAVFTLWCVLLSPVMTLVRDLGRSVWAAGILHGTLNALGQVTIGMISEPAFPWNGIVGVGGLIALAIGVLAIFLVQRATGEAYARATS